MVRFEDVEAAATTLSGVAHRTPVLTSRLLDARAGARVFLKCENFQRTGAFKFRGAYNALSRLSEAEKACGVLTYSSGNHAQAVALACRLLGMSATIVMPRDAPRVKLEATRDYGATIVPYDRSTATREALAARLSDELGLPTIPPYDHPDIIAGQGTAGLELVGELPDLDTVVVPCGGGGLLSGVALAANGLAPGCRIIGVEPLAANDATLSFRTRRLHRVHNPDTIADGARTPSLGKHTFPMVLRYVHDMVTVTEDAIREAVLFLWERLKIVAEPTGALGVAALLSGALRCQGTRVGAIISGGNLDARALFTPCRPPPTPTSAASP